MLKNTAIAAMAALTIAAASASPAQALSKKGAFWLGIGTAAAVLTPMVAITAPAIAVDAPTVAQPAAVPTGLAGTHGAGNVACIAVGSD